MNNYATRKYSGEITARLACGIHERAEHEIHTENELFYLYEGTALIYSELGQETVSGGTLVVIPKGFYHRIAYDTSVSEPLRCTCHFDSLLGFDSLATDRLSAVRFINNEEIDKAFNGIRNIFSKSLDEMTEKALLKSYVGLTLAAIGKSNEGNVSSSPHNSIVKKTIEYINKNISDDLTADKIALALHVSASYLRQLFRREMSTPLHQYVLQKRLILANNKIMNSTPAVIAASECGFSDYSNFYTQYKKRFGVAPSMAKKQEILDKSLSYPTTFIDISNEICLR